MTSPDVLIKQLAHELKAVKPPIKPLKAIIVWASYSFIATSLLVIVCNFRSDLLLQVQNEGFLLRSLLLIATSVIAGAGAILLSRPDLQGRWKMAFPVTALFLWSILLFDFLSQRHINTTSTSVGAPDFLCWAFITFATLLTLVPLIFLQNKGFVLSQPKAALCCAIASSTLGLMALDFHCGSIRLIHIVGFHILPFAIIIALSGPIHRGLRRFFNSDPSS